MNHTTYTQGRCRKVSYCKPPLGCSCRLAGDLAAVGFLVRSTRVTERRMEKLDIVESCGTTFGHDRHSFSISCSNLLPMQRLYQGNGTSQAFLTKRETVLFGLTFLRYGGSFDVCEKRRKVTVSRVFQNGSAGRVIRWCCFSSVRSMFRTRFLAAFVLEVKRSY